MPTPNKELLKQMRRVRKTSLEFAARYGIDAYLYVNSGREKEAGDAARMAVVFAHDAERMTARIHSVQAGY